jgi:hypothetical protein
MTPEISPEPARPGPARPVRSRGPLPWLVVAGTLIGAAAVLSVARAPDGRPGPRSQEHVAPLALSKEEVARAVQGDSVAEISPPIDVDAAETWAGRLPFGALPVPAERDVRSWRTPGGGEITQAVLYYPDPADAERLASRAGSLLSTGLGLSSTPLALRGADRAMTVSGADFRGIAFTKGGHVVLVGAYGQTGEGAPEALARAVLDRVPARAVTP